MTLLTNSIPEFARIVGTSVQRVLHDLREHHANEDPSRRKSVKSMFQKAIYTRLMHAKMPIGEDRFHIRLARWQLPGIPLRVARRALRQLNDLRGLVPPRISAAILSTAWNRWCTSRRFQVRCGRDCTLGCGADEDSTEHYSRCVIMHNFATEFLRLSFCRARGLEVFTFCYDGWSSQKEMIKAGILIYATYRVTETLRKENAVHDAATVSHMLQQASREAVKGHVGCMRILDDPR